MRSRWNGTRALLFLALESSPGCASRTVPAVFPAGSAASPNASQADAAVVTGALTEEPPLPGQPTTRWPGLQPPGHGGHHAH